MPRSYAIACDHRAVGGSSLSMMMTLDRHVFGEFLVNQHVIDRFQLFRALQLQDRLPGTRLGQCAVYLGYVPRGTVERAHVLFTRSVPLPALDVAA